MAVETLPSPGVDEAVLPPSLPIVPSTIAFGRDPIAFFVDSYRRYGPAFRLNAFDFNLTVMLGANAHRALFAEHGDKLSARKGYSLLLSLLDDALLVTDGARHAKQKRLIQPAFHTKRIERYLSIMHDVAERHMARWHDGDVVDVYAEARNMTLEVVVRALTGWDTGRDHGELATTLTQLFDYTTQPNIRKWLKLDVPFTGYGKSKRARLRLDAMLYAVIAQREAGGTHTDDMLSWLMETRDDDGTKLTPSQIRDQVLLLIYAGHDTATCTLAWALHLLATHPRAVQPIVDELTQARFGRDMPLSALRAMPQLDMVLDETLRLYPPVWIGLRGVTEPFEFEGMRIPANTTLLYSAGASHRLAEVFDEPNLFRPERFALENKARLPAFSYIPYGGGAHMCVGMPFAQVELKVLLAHILGRWQVEPVAQKPIAMHYNPTLAPAHGIPLRIRRR